MRLPSTFCWPTQAIICEMLMKEPLEPVVTMFLTLLVSLSDFCARVPAVSRALLSTWLTLFSKLSIIVRPGWHSSWLFCAFSTRALTWLGLGLGLGLGVGVGVGLGLGLGTN